MLPDCGMTPTRAAAAARPPPFRGRRMKVAVSKGVSFAKLRPLRRFAPSLPQAGDEKAAFLSSPARGGMRKVMEGSRCD